MMENPIIMFEYAVCQLAVAYYLFWLVAVPLTKKVSGVYDPINQASHLACPLLMIPMCGIGWMGEPALMQACSNACLLMFILLIGAWASTRLSRMSAGGGIRQHMKKPWGDLGHALMFGVMWLQYEQHYTGLADEWRLAMKAGGLLCVCYGVWSLSFALTNPNRSRGLKLFHRVAHNLLHAILYICTGGMVWMPKIFMA